MILIRIKGSDNNRALKLVIKYESRVQAVSLINVQGDQLNMAVFVWYLGKSDLSSVYVYSSV